MQSINLSDAVFDKLKAISEPFVDTPESRISRLIDDELNRVAIAGDESRGGRHVQLQPDTALHLNPDSHENLAFTKVLSASIDGRELHRPKWNSFMNQVHLEGLRRLGSFDALNRVSGARLTRERLEDDGFRYLPEGGFSIQGVDSNKAWDHSLAVARAIKVPIVLRFRWRDKKGAAHPGQIGVLKWNPPGAIELASRQISPEQAQSLRTRLKSFEQDWRSPEMDVYDAI